MDLSALNDPATVLKLFQQLGEDSDSSDEEIDTVNKTVVECDLDSSILEDFKLLIQISLRDDPSDRAFFRQVLDRFLQ